MEIHQLRYFVAISDVGSFTGAAKACNVAQPSLSQQIRKLEGELGHQLFDRLGRQVVLTDAGTALLPRARRILAELREVQQHLPDEITGGGTLVVGAIPTMAPYLLPDALSGFAKSRPRTRVQVVEDFTDRLVEALVRAEIDLAIVSPPIDHSAVEVEVLFEEPLYVAVRSDDPWADQDSVTLSQLTERESIVLDDSVHCLGRQVDEFCRAMHVAQNVSCRATQMATLQRMVEMGHGVALVPEMAVRADRTNSRKYLPLSDANPRRGVAVATRIGRSRSFLAGEFVKAIERPH